MIPVFRRICAACILSLVAILSSFCAPKNFLVINYQLPKETVKPEDNSVSFVFKDVRDNPAILTKNARMALKGFSGHFALIVTRENKSERLVGAYSLSSMIREIFKQRLENADLRVASEEESQELIFEIILKEFQIDLVKHKWLVKIAYQANLVKKSRMVAGETIKGSAERLRVAGSKNAEIVIGELITDVVNKLDLNAFFRSNEI